VKRFKDFFESQQVLGTVEEVEIDGIGRLSARIDTGNTGYNVIHADNITPIKDNKVRFLTVNDKTLVMKIVDTIEILAGEKIHDRYVVHLNMRIGPHFFENVPFSLSDRSSNQEKVLIGEPFLKKIDAVVDTNKSKVV